MHVSNVIIQTSNINDSAVTSEKIKDGSIVSSKIDWKTIKTNNSLRFGDVLIQWGRVDGSTNGQEGLNTVSLPISYNNKQYQVFLTPSDMPNQRNESVNIKSREANQFQYYLTSDVANAGVATVEVHWMTIGTV